jgi:beta-galactosidase/beta-glucuronidase
MQTISRKEHPRPQMVRENWINLNGTWEFEIDQACSGKERGIWAKDRLEREIIVPFCPETELSGINEKDFMNGVWYARTVQFPHSFENGRTILHFGAADYATTLWVNGKEIGIHIGGYTSFEFDITEAICPCDNRIVVYCEDDTRDNFQPTGKQSSRWASYDCVYTRTTGIWQTVWAESVPQVYIKSMKLFPNVADGSVTIDLSMSGCLYGRSVLAKSTYNGMEAGFCKVISAGNNVVFTLPLNEKHLWEIGNGRLYDLEIVAGDDILKSYFGLRNVTIDGKKIFLNGKPFFQRLILDQGFYPDGIYTAPSDEALIKDIELSMAMGFNGARLHQKVFEERFLYHADRMGYICWGEFPNWGVDMNTPAKALEVILPQWLEEIQRDFNHPAIICWCPLNETRPERRAEIHSCLYYATKAADNTRPCIDTSGYNHVITDIWDVHDYDQNAESYKQRYELEEFRLHPFINFPDTEKFDGSIPYINSEFGGIYWYPQGGGWGYGDSPKTLDEFYVRYEGLVKALLDNEDVAGFCYTQLTDVEQEHNGLYYYDRSDKFDSSRICAATSAPAAIENFDRR